MNILKQNKQGITALVAVMVMSIALTLGVGIFQLLFAEMLLARDQANSVIAEYAAESGIECAKYNIYAKNYDVTAPSPADFWCNGNNLRVVGGMGGLTVDPYDMTRNEACTEIRITYVDDVPTAGERLITLQSRGRYPCDNPRVERGIQNTLKQAIPQASP